MPGQIVFVVARDPSRRRALARALSGAPELQAVTMSGCATIASLARSARPVAIVVEADDAPLLEGLAEQVETGAIPVVAFAAGASLASAVAAVRAAVAPAPLA